VDPDNRRNLIDFFLPLSKIHLQQKLIQSQMYNTCDCVFEVVMMVVTVILLLLFIKHIIRNDDCIKISQQQLSKVCGLNLGSLKERLLYFYAADCCFVLCSLK